MRARGFTVALLAVCVLGLLLRVRGYHAPLLDHPGWRQGDTAAIARNFATLQLNPLFPQTDYDGPPPNYVELELQIVPFLAALFYKLVGVHEVIGRLIGIAFGVATIAVVGVFGRWLFESAFAGIAAAAMYAVVPGPVYYSHTFMPDTTMVFFTVAALYACARWIVEEPDSWRRWSLAAVLLATAFLAKPVAVTAIVPVASLALATWGIAGTLRRPQSWALLATAFVPLAVYDQIVSAHAEWHWASQITSKHVIPELRAALTTSAGFVLKVKQFAGALRMLATTMLGPVGAVAGIAGFVRLRSRADALLWGWLAGGLLYAYVVVTVERVDYYLYLLVPLGALAAGGAVARVLERVEPSRRLGVAIALAAIPAGTIALTERTLAPYYVWSHANYARATQLAKTLPDGLIVMGHYDPSIMYYLAHKGWEEDPHLWTPFDEQSAIRKGARAYVSVEHRRLKLTNLELYCWLSTHFPVDERTAWPVYLTDPAHVLPGAEDRWHAFRAREARHEFDQWRAQGATADPCPPSVRLDGARLGRESGQREQ